MPYQVVDGRRWFYAVHPGDPERPPVVLIHGAGGNHLVWPAQVRRLPHYTVYAPDLPGHGRSEGPALPSIPAYRDALLAWADALGLETFVPVGHSMGGAIAQELALAVPRRLAALVLVATGARLRVHPSILRGLRENFEDTVRFLSQWAYGDEPPPPLLDVFVEQVMATSPEVVYGDFAACDVWDRMGDVKDISVPTLVLGGESDRLTPPKFLRYLAEHIPQAELVLIPGAGHMVMVEAPDAVARAISTWLERVVG